MKIAGSQVGDAGLAQFTGFERTEVLAARQAVLPLVPPRVAGFCGGAKSLPLPIQMVPVPSPVTFGTFTPWTALTSVAPVPGLSKTRNEPAEVAPLVVTPP